MKQAERTERAKNAIMLAGLKHFGQRGFKGTTVAMLEAETGFTRGSFFTHYKNMSEIFEATVNRYYFNRVTACSVPEEYRESLRDFYTKLVSMYETECIEMLGKGVKHLAKVYIIIEGEALNFISDFKERCEKYFSEQKEVWMNVVANAIKSKEISINADVETIAQMFWSALTGHILDASIKGNICYTDGLAYQMDNIYKLMLKPTLAL